MELLDTLDIRACTIAPEAKISAAALIQRLSAEFIEARPVWKPMHCSRCLRIATIFRTATISFGGLVQTGHLPAVRLQHEREFSDRPCR